MTPAGSLHGGARQDILDQLGNFATMMRYLEGHAAAEGRDGIAHPAVSVLERALPVLQKIMQKEELQADAEVFSALCEVISGLAACVLSLYRGRSAQHNVA